MNIWQTRWVSDSQVLTYLFVTSIIIIINSEWKMNKYVDNIVDNNERRALFGKHRGRVIITEFVPAYLLLWIISLMNSAIQQYIRTW